MAVKHGPCFLTLKKERKKKKKKKSIQAFRNQVHEEASSYLPLGAQDQRLDAELDRLPCGCTGTSSVNCRDRETCMVRA